MKPYDIFKKRKLGDKEDKIVWNKIKYKHCAVVLYDNKTCFCVVKEDTDKYLILWKDLGSDGLKIVTDPSPLNLIVKYVNKIKFKDKRLFKEFEEYLVAEGI